MDIKTDPVAIIPVDQDGYTMGSVPINYTIEPAGYKATTAYVVILEKGEPITYIPSETQGEGFATISRGFKFDLSSTYEARVVLNKGTGVEIKSSKIPLTFTPIYIERDDPEYPDVELRWNDYYPPLGDKTITIRGDVTGQGSLDGRTIRAEVVYPQAGAGFAVAGNITKTAQATFNNGRATFELSARGLAPSVPYNPDTDQIEIKFSFPPASGEGGSEAELFGTWYVRNNSNTALAEVLRGEAVFIYDIKDEDSHKGETGDKVTNDGEKKFDFFQELLNQVVPRKRSVKGYTLMDENGVFDFKVKNALALFKEHFKVDNTTAGSDFRKLEKDYSLVNSSWANQVIGKKILMGKNVGDNQINASTADDTGLYELYENVVEVFVKKIIEEAERYAGSAPTDNWWSRTGEGTETETLDDHGPGMSYCYGGKNSIGQFNSQDNGVSKCMPETQTNIYAREGTGDPDYRGNINENIIDENYYCAVAGGNKKWPGLYQVEWNGWYAYYKANPTSEPTDHPFHPSHWAGIDCSGLVQRVMAYDVPWTEIAIPPRPTSQNVEMLFTVDVDDKMLYFEENLKKNIKKGDLVRYGDTHVSIVYSDRTSDASHYEIIHAYGINTYTYPDHAANAGLKIFSRKVLKTWENIGSPTGFGRIKLWE